MMNHQQALRLYNVLVKSARTRYDDPVEDYGDDYGDGYEDYGPPPPPRRRYRSFTMRPRPRYRGMDDRFYGGVPEQPQQSNAARNAAIIGALIGAAGGGYAGWKKAPTDEDRIKYAIIGALGGAGLGGAGGYGLGKLSEGGFELPSFGGGEQYPAEQAVE